MNLKKAEGILFIITGILFSSLRVVYTVDLDLLRTITMANMWEFAEMNETYNLLNHIFPKNPVVYIISILFIAIGVIKLKEAGANAT